VTYQSVQGIWPEAGCAENTRGAGYIVGEPGSQGGKAGLLNIGALHGVGARSVQGVLAGQVRKGALA